MKNSEYKQDGRSTCLECKRDVDTYLVSGAAYLELPVPTDGPVISRHFYPGNFIEIGGRTVQTLGFCLGSLSPVRK